LKPLLLVVLDWHGLEKIILYLKFKGGFKRGIMFQQVAEHSEAQKIQFVSKSTTSFRCILFIFHCIQQSIYTLPFENQEPNLAQ
jgi:hypothetical protein